ncbi:MAG: choice-of-anchor B family protein [Flavobacteriales bacterium]|nr:choice-of-anchor B family protein [Flavobacteriales bacterium]
MRIFCVCLIIFCTATGIQAQVDSNVTMLYHWMDTTIKGTTAYNNAYNEIWGITEGDREYAIIGSTEGTHIFDVTDPQNSVLVDFVQGRDHGQHIIHRDYHDYKGYLYMVSDEGESSLQIADLSYLPDSVHVVYDSQALFKRSHNIFIDSATARLYVCSVYSVARGYNGLEVYSLANPLQPELILEYPDIGTVHDIFVKNDTGYVHNGGKGFHMIDFGDTANVMSLGTLEFYPDKGYNHSGWLTENGKYYVMADETHGLDMKMLDVQDPMDIKVLSTFGSHVDTNSVAHNPLIKGNYVYASYYHDGFQMFNIADPAQPVKVGYYKTYAPSDHDSYRGAWGCYPFLPSGIVLVSDMQYGLFVLDVSQALTTSVPEQNQLSMECYPNPFTDRLYIRLPGNGNKTADFILADLAGKTISNGMIQGNHIDMAQLPAGMYLLTIRHDGLSATRRVVRVP